jgi:hypothetical protein
MSHGHSEVASRRLRAASVFIALSTALALSWSDALPGPPAASQASVRPPPEPRARAGQRDVAPAPAAVEVVVKFKDDGKVKDIIDAFWKDPQAAKAKFDSFKRGRPEMTGAKLDRVTYSNELVLVYPCVAALKSERAAATQEIVGRLMASPDISYAEPEMTAQTQG